MPARITIRATALLIGAVTVGACSGGGPTAAPATQTPVTQAPITQGPIATDGALPSLNLESFHGATDLEALLPDQIGGEAITKLSMGGEEFLGSGMADTVQTALTALGKQPSDLSVAFGGNTLVEIIAFQVKGVSGSSILDAFKASAGAGATTTDVSLGGKSVKKIVTADSTDANYVYTVNDVVFSVSGSGITDALLTETFSKLP